MATIIPFPIHRSQASARDQRIFQAQMEFERTNRQGVIFFALAAVAVVILMGALDLAALFR